jgi:hypothetical protein
MAHVGTSQLACASNDQWLAAFEYLLSSEEARRDAAGRGQIYAQTHHGPPMVLARWDAMFASLGYDFADDRQAREPVSVPYR